MGELSKLKGLGTKSEKSLNKIGIYTLDDLKKNGPVRAFIKLKTECSIKPSLNFLYAMVGAIENVHWAKVAKTEKRRLVMELEDYKELQKFLEEEGIESEI